MTSHSTDTDETVTVATYRLPEYVPESWPVVSDEQHTSRFIPEEFSQVGEAVYAVDAMFADFGAKEDNTIELSSEAGDFELHPAVELSDEGDSAPVIEDVLDISEDTPSISAPEVVECFDSSAEAVDCVHPAEEDETSEEEPLAQTEPLNVEHEQRLEDIDSGSSMQLDEERLQEALSQSYEKGRLDGRQEVEEIQRQLEERYRLLWEDMQTQLDEALRSNEHKAVELALQVARRMVGGVIENQRDYIHEVIRQAIAVAGGAEISAVRVSPKDYEFLKLSEYGDTKKILSGRHISFVSDESIRAGCVLVTNAGEVDFDLDKAWERMRAKAVQEPEP
jgi:flagellar biosynthesis/type III secretory pathway protein FliH